MRWERTDGKVIRRNDNPMLPEDGELSGASFEKPFAISKFKFNINIIYSYPVRDNWEQICDFKHSHHPVNIHGLRDILRILFSIFVSGNL